MTLNTSTLLPTPVTDPAFQLSPYHLTPEQVRFYGDNGYLILRHWIPDDLLSRLQDALNLLRTDRETTRKVIVIPDSRMEASA